MKNIFTLILITLLTVSCADTEKKKPVSNMQDYTHYLNSEPEDLTRLNQQVELWTNKIKQEPKGFTFYEKLGSSYHQLFEKTGQVSYLHKADSSFAIAEKLTRGKWKVPSLISLSSMAVKRHDFKAAAEYAVNARELSEEKLGPLLMQFDAEMELGNYQMAGAILAENKRMDSFDYLVRLSKYKDHEGDLDSAIYYMEEANDLIKSHQMDRKLWATANLADMYGHAGRVEGSYRKYLEVLSMDPSYDYALKGIAWVTYSYDGKTAEAKRILKKLQAKTNMPDYYLQLAEISDFEGNVRESEEYVDQFLKEATKPEYQGMYNKYLIDIYLDQGHFEKAIRLANIEVEKRPTPATYDWLAWALYRKGEMEKSIEVYERNVEGKTFEPDVIYHMGVVFHKADKDRGSDYLKESLEAAYELGPHTEREIREILKV